MSDTVSSRILVQPPLLAHEHGAAHGVDDVIVAFEIDDVAARERVGVRRELVRDLLVPLR